jgi:hypothetical protein
VLRKVLCVSLVTLCVAAALPAEAEAQRRAVRRSGSRSAVFVSARRYSPVYYSRYYWPAYAGWYGGWYGGWHGAGLYGPAWYGPGWYGAGWYGWNGWGPYGYYGQYGPYRYRYDTSSSARIEVKPREAEVYVDGRLVGTVDDFDGWLQRLHLPAGEHDVEIYMAGHKTMRERVLFRPGATVKINGVLEPLPSGSADEPRPRPSERADAPPRRGGTYPPPGPRRGHPEDERRDRPAPDDSGSVSVRVQPADAEVLIDGERWESPSGERLVVQLGEGEHRIEIRREGYQTYSTTVRVRRGETVPVNVSLTRR